MKVWLDDERCPKDYGYDDYFWYKDGRDLIWSFEDIENNVTHFHLDHYLEDDHITGYVVFQDIIFDLTNEGKFKNLKYIYIHTSCEDSAHKFLNLAKSEEVFKKFGVKVIKKEVFKNDSCY